tara:strand:- start:14465 stop:15346 length:882 start_codon:yes stop_codon:yes gene_type:complete
MAILSVNTPYVDGGTVTSTNLNALVTDSEFVAGATDNVTTEISSGAIIVRDGGISINKLNTSLSGAIELQGTAYVGSDKTGNTRGANSLDIQSERSDVSKVASGINCVALGISNKAGNGSSSAIGIKNSTTQGECTAVGYDNSTSSYQSAIFGRSNLCEDPGGTSGGRYSQLIFGGGCRTKQYGCTAVGYGVEIDSGSGQGTLEIGNWGYKKANRINTTSGAGCSLRMHNNGQVAFTMANSPTTPTDGGATDGNEATGTLPRSMFTIQNNLGDITLYYNNAGTISSLALGTLS